MSDLSKKIRLMNQQVSRWARRTGNVVSQWWETLNTLQQKRAEIRRLARERQQLLIDMGNKVYTLHRKGKVQNRDLRSDCERIDQISADIARLEQEIEELKRAREEAQPREIPVEDETPVVADEEADVGAAPEDAATEEVGAESPPETPEPAEATEAEAVEDEVPPAETAEEETEEETGEEASVEGVSETEAPPAAPHFAPPQDTGNTEPSAEAQGPAEDEDKPEDFRPQW